LKNHDTIYFCIDEPNQPYKGVRGKGKVTVHENVDHNVSIEEKIIVKYLKSGSKDVNGHVQKWECSYHRNYSKLFFNMGL
jgi:hypothetical protein